MSDNSALPKPTLTRDWLERLFVFYLFANPLFDILNGLFIYITRNMGHNMNDWALPVTPTLMIRMSFLALMGIYILILKDFTAIKYLVPIAVAGVMSMVIEYVWVRNGYNMFTDIQYVTRFAYNVVILFVYKHVLTSPGKYNRGSALLLLRKVFLWSSMIISASVIICFVASSLFDFRIGFPSYADRFGLRGSSGFYFAANEATAVLMLLLPFSIYEFFLFAKPTNRWSVTRFICPAMMANALFIIGTKTAFISLIITTVSVTVYVLVHCFRTREFAKLERLGLLIASIAALFLLLSVAGMQSSVSSSFDKFDEIYKQELDEESLTQLIDNDQRLTYINDTPMVRLLLSGRNYYLLKAFDLWSSNGFPVWIFGIGRSSTSHTIEMDLFEVLFYYGIFGLVFMSLPYIREGFRLLKSFFKKKSGMLSICIMLSLSLAFGYAFLAGHVFFSVTGGYYFVVIMVFGWFFFDDDATDRAIRMDRSMSAENAVSG